MTKSIALILVDKRKENAVNVQKILTDWGCLIKTRLGIHDGVLDNCTNSGFIMLELVGDATKKKQLIDKLKVLSGVDARLIELAVAE